MLLAWHAPMLVVASMALCSCIQRDPCTLEVPVTEEFCSRLLTATNASGAAVIGRLAATYDELPCYRCGEDPVPTADDPTPYEPEVWMLRFDILVDQVLYAAAAETPDRFVVYDGAECLRVPPDEIFESSWHARCRSTLDSVTIDRSALWLLELAIPGDTYYLASRCHDRHDPDVAVIWQPTTACSSPILREEGQDQWFLGTGFAVTTGELNTIIAAAGQNASAPVPDYGPDACRSWIERVTGRAVPTTVGGCD